MLTSARSARLAAWSITVSLAGFLFGFDTIVISGADIPIRNLWNTSPWFHGNFIMAMALWGTVIGAILGNVPCDRFGRKKTLVWIGLFYLISAVGSALAWDPYSFSAFRFIGGLAVGASSIAAPAYIAEISHSNNRGRLVALYQFNIVFGILVGLLSNYLIGDNFGMHSWRWMLGMEVVPAGLYLMMLTTVPESPRWLVLHKNDQSRARLVLEQIHTADEAAEVLDSIRRSVPETSATSARPRGLSQPLALAFLIACFNQFSGINVVFYYAPRLLASAGAGIQDALLQATSLGFVNLVFTVIGMVLIDRAGRKRLLLIGSVGYIISLSVVAWAYATGASQTIILAFLLMFIAAHAIGQGAVIWVFIAEIFPNAYRARGQSWGAGTHWVIAATATAVTPWLIDDQQGVFKGDPSPLFAFFAGMMVLQLLFVIFVMPETKGQSLEELESKTGMRSSPRL